MEPSKPSPAPPAAMEMLPSPPALFAKDSAPTAPVPERYLRPSEVQAMLGVSRTTLWRWHAERGLKVVIVGGVTRIRQSDLEEFLRKHERDTP